MITPIWKILLLMSVLGLTLSYQATVKLDQRTYMVSYTLRNGHLTTVRISSGYMEIIDPNGLRIGNADIVDPVEIAPGGQATLKIHVVLTEPLSVLTKRYAAEERVTFRGHIMYDTGWLSWLLGSGKLEFDEKVPIGMILEYLGLYGVE